MLAHARGDTQDCMGVSKNGVFPKMDGENDGKPYFFNGWFWGTIIFGNTHMDHMLLLLLLLLLLFQKPWN